MSLTKREIQQIAIEVVKYLKADEVKLRPVSRKKALKESGLTDWELRKAVEEKPGILVGRNKYDLQLLKAA